MKVGEDRGDGRIGKIGHVRDKGGRKGKGGRYPGVLLGWEVGKKG